MTPPRHDLLAYLEDFGWRDVDRGEPVPPPAAGASGAKSGDRDATPAAGADPLAEPSLEAMAAALAGCRRCRLCKDRTQVVFGVGSPAARVMFVGEGPGRDEDRQGEPFVGRAGQLLNAMLSALDMRREDVYIANIVKCRPPGNRDPEGDEAETCLPFLRRQAELVAPEVVVTLGRIAARYLLKTTAPISSYRGRWQSWEGRDVLPTFHPAYLLRNPAAKAQAWVDLKALRRRLRGA